MVSLRLTSLLLALALLFQTPAIAAQSSNVPSLTLGNASAFPGGLTIDEANSKGYFTIYCAFVAGTTGYVAPFWKNGVQYQVTTGKTFKVAAVLFMGDSTGVGTQLFTSTATFSADAAVGTLTSPVWQAGASGRYPFRSIVANQYTTFNVTYSFAALTYPGCQNSSAGNTISVMLIGKEE